MLDTSEPPDGDLAKEVYAHFGLCMYLAQVFETGLINILAALETAASSVPTQTTFDRLYEEHEALTFGKLTKKLRQHNFLPDQLLDETEALKSIRDHLAHRFFRDHDLDFVTIAGSMHMIEQLEAYRDRFAIVDEAVTRFQSQAFTRIGISTEQFFARTADLEATVREEAKSRYSSKLNTTD